MSNFQYIQIEDKDILSGYIKDGGLHELYNLCFNAPPYNEYFEINEIRRIFGKYCTDGILYLCLDGKKVIGFIAAFPLKLEEKVYQIVKNHLVDVDKYWYHADIGTHPDPEYRRKGIAKTLWNAILNKVPTSHFVARTQEGNEASKSLHLKLGFQILAHVDGTFVTQDVHRDDRHEPDKRIFLYYERD